jgi:hypothetical protein
LEFKHRRRGRPELQPGSGGLSTPEDKLIDALKRGDSAAAGAALRAMKRLHGPALDCLALLLEDSPKLGPSFPWRLLLRYRRRGRPYNLLRSGVKTFGRSLAFANAKADIVRSGKKPKVEAAVAAVMEKSGCSRSTIFNAVKQHRPKIG